MKRYGLFLIAILILIGACEIKDPVLPKWDVDLSIPLLNQFFYVSDLVDSVNIVTDANEVINITAEGHAETPEFGPVPFDPDTQMENIPIPGTGQDVFIPFIDSDGITEASYAQIDFGTFLTRFTEVHSSVQEIKLVFHNMFTPTGAELEIVYNGTSGWVTTQLGGIHLGTENSEEIISELPVTVVVSPALPEGTIAARFGFQATATMGFSEFQGRLNNYTLELNSSLGDIDIEYPYGINNAIALQEASLRLSLKNYIGFAARFEGRIRAENDEGEVRYVDVLDDQGNYYYTEPATGDVPGLSVIDFHTNVSELLQIMPTHLTMVDGRLTISSGQNIGSVEIDDKVYVDFMINAPMTFVLHEHEIVVREEQEISISESNRDLIRDKALGATLNLWVKNTIPIGAWANAYISDSPNIDVNDPATYDILEHAEIHSFEINPDWQLQQITLTKPELDVFTQPNVYLRWSFSFQESSGPVTIHARTTDFIQVKGMMIANVLVEE